MWVPAEAGPGTATARVTFPALTAFPVAAGTFQITIEPPAPAEPAPAPAPAPTPGPK